MKLIILVLLSLLYCAVTSGAPDETSLAKDLPEIPKDAQEVIEREVQDPETAKKDVQALLAQDEKKPLLAVRKKFCTIPWAWSFPLKCAHLATCHMYKKIGKKYQIVAVTVQSNRSFCCRNCNCQFWSCVFSPYFPNSFCYQRLYKCQCKCLTLPLPKGCIQ